MLSAAVAVATLAASTNAVFTMKISRNPEASSLKKRGIEVRSTITESLANNATGGDYIAQVQVGHIVSIDLANTVLKEPSFRETYSESFPKPEL